MNELLTTALEFRAIGIATIPIATDKRPPTNFLWKKFQTRLPTQDELEQAFQYSGISGLAIILGTVSGDLCCRDFDAEAPYHRWAAQNPTLAAWTPTAKTRRGFHCYFVDWDAAKTTKLANGELRAAGSYVLAPPSIHPSGCRYEWLPGTPPLKHAPAISAEYWLREYETRRFNPKESPVTQSVATVTQTPVTHCLGNIVIPNWLIPKEAGRRHHAIMGLVRWIKGRYPNITEAAALAVFNQWFTRAVSSIATKEFATSRGEFISCFRDYRGGDLAAALAAVNCELSPLDRLIGVCRELAARSAEGRFFLPVRIAGKVVGGNAMTGLRALQRLCVDGVIRLEKRGDNVPKPGAKANEYRLIRVESSMVDWAKPEGDARKAGF